MPEGLWFILGILSLLWLIAGFVYKVHNKTEPSVKTQQESVETAQKTVTKV